MSDIALSTKFSQSESDNSQRMKNKSKSPCFFNKYNIEREILNDENSDFVSLIREKKELKLNRNKYEILKNRVHNLQQMQLDNLKQIESMKQRAKKISVIIVNKKENKKLIDESKIKAQENLNLMKEKVKNIKKNNDINLKKNIANRNMNLLQKANTIKMNKIERKNIIERNNNNILNQNKIKYDKIKTINTIMKDRNKITKAEQDEKKKKIKKNLIEQEKCKNKALEENIQLLEQQEKNCLVSLRKTLMMKKENQKSMLYTYHFKKKLIDDDICNRSFDTKRKENRKCIFHPKHLSLLVESNSDIVKNSCNYFATENKSNFDSKKNKFRIFVRKNKKIFGDVSNCKNDNKLNNSYDAAQKVNDYNQI